MRALSPIAAPYVLLRHRDAVPCVIPKEELIEKKRGSDRLFVRRAIIFIVFLVCLIVTGLKFVRFSEERGYFDWAANVDLRPVVFAFGGLLLATLVWILVGLERQKRRAFSPPCPKCGRPLIGANLWPPVKICTDALAERREQRMQKLLLRASSRYVIAPAFIVMLLSFPIALLIMRYFRPDLDPDGWPFFLRTFPLITLMYLVAGYLLTLFYVRGAIRRNGEERALTFLFPDWFKGRRRWRDKMFYLVLGISDIVRSIEKR